MAQRSSYYYVEALRDLHDIKKIKKGLDTLPGVKSVSTNIETHQVCVDYDNTGVSAAGLLNKLYAIGYDSVMLRDEHSF